MKIIDSFWDDYRFLSNFFFVVVELDGETYPTIEHAYQAAKTLDPVQRQAIRKCRSPGQAKRMGQYVTMRPDWDDIKIATMCDLLRQKFGSGYLRTALLATDNAILIEGNNHGDTFWGICNGRGANNLGRLLMKVREEQQL
jgi:ribA/ribD-fused uncharacterized protein